MPAGLVVIPAYNEAPRIGDVLAAVARHAPDFDRLVVDDGSADATAAAARAAGATVVSHPFNLGYGAALQTGYRWALRHGYAVVVQLDADGQHDPAGVLALAAPVLAGELDLVLGSRFHPGSSYRMQPLRRLGSRWFSGLVRWLTGLSISDPTTGFQALSRAVLRLYTSDAFPADYPDADMPVLLHRNGLRVGERPVRMFERPELPSMHHGLRVLYYVYKMTLAILMNAIRPPQPRAAKGDAWTP
jgi:glycosyltransferase involved in cell wall biosynthesis